MTDYEPGAQGMLGYIYSGEGGSVVLKWSIKQTKTKQKPEFDIK